MALIVKDFMKVTGDQYLRVDNQSQIEVCGKGFKGWLAVKWLRVKMLFSESARRNYIKQNKKVMAHFFATIAREYGDRLGYIAFKHLLNDFQEGKPLTGYKVKFALERVYQRAMREKMALKFSQGPSPEHDRVDYVEAEYEKVKAKMKFDKSLKDLGEEKEQRLRNEIREEIETCPVIVDEDKVKEIIKRKVERLIKIEVNADNAETAKRYAQKHDRVDYVEAEYEKLRAKMNFDKSLKDLGEEKEQRLRDEIREEIETYPVKVDEDKAITIIKRKAERLITREINAEMAKKYAQENVIKKEFENIKGELNWDKSVDDVPQTLIHRFCERVKERIENHNEIVDEKKALKIIREEIKTMVAVCKIAPKTEAFLEKLEGSDFKERVKAMATFTKTAITLSKETGMKAENYLPTLLTEAIYHGIESKGYDHNTIQPIYRKLASDEGLDFIQALNDIAWQSEDTYQQAVGMSLWNSFSSILTAFVEKSGFDERNYEKEMEKVQGSGKPLDQISENIKNLVHQIISDNADWYKNILNLRNV